MHTNMHTKAHIHTHPPQLRDSADDGDLVGGAIGGHGHQLVLDLNLTRATSTVVCSAISHDGRFVALSDSSEIKVSLCAHTLTYTLAEFS